MLNLHPVAILSKVRSRMMKVKLDAIPICDREMPGRKLDRRLERNPILSAVAGRGWLRSHAKVVRENGQVFTGFERNARADPLIDRPGHVTAKADDTQQHQ